ncbi:VanZ family protein [Nocardioides pacificus]
MGAYCLGLALVLFNPSNDVPTQSIRWFSDLGRALGMPEQLSHTSRVEFGLNVLILVPFSVLGALITRKADWRIWVAYGFVFSGLVELTQGLALGARSATFSDVVANTLGAGLGAAGVAVLIAVRPGHRST